MTQAQPYKTSLEVLFQIDESSPTGLSYASGELYHKLAQIRSVKGRRTPWGQPCGSLNDKGYYRYSGNIYQQATPVARIVYCLHHGLELEDIAGKYVVPINGIKTDNRVANLMLSDSRKQAKAGHLRYTTKAGNTGRWKSQPRYKGETTYLGTFDTRELAHQHAMEFLEVLSD